MKKRLLLVLVVLMGMFLSTASIVWAQAAPVAKTGQTLCYSDNGTEISCAGTGQDGEHQKGIASPSPRFTDHGDGTVTDNLTRLMWTKDANVVGEYINWNAALDYANNLSLGSDGCGTNYTDWRLPNRFELGSLLHLGVGFPLVTPLPTGHPFTNVQSLGHWTSTTVTWEPDNAWALVSGQGREGAFVLGDKTGLGRVWPVRDAN